MGAFYVFFGIKDTVPALPKNNFWLHRTKNHDFDETLDTFFNLDVDEYLEAPAPSMFLSFSSAKDSNYRQRHSKVNFELFTAIFINFSGSFWNITVHGKI